MRVRSQPLCLQGASRQPAHDRNRQRRVQLPTGPHCQWRSNSLASFTRLNHLSDESTIRVAVWHVVGRGDTTHVVVVAATASIRSFDDKTGSALPQQQVPPPRPNLLPLLVHTRLSILPISSSAVQLPTLVRKKVVWSSVTPTNTGFSALVQTTTETNFSTTAVGRGVVGGKGWVIKPC